MTGPLRRYLVVDDDSTNNLICDFTIKRFDRNARVDLFIEPEKALMHIEQNYPCSSSPFPTVLFLDVNMPTMSGFDFLEEFRNFETTIQQQFSIYMLSSSIEDFNSKAQKYPFVAGFLSKPLKISHLEEISNP